MKPEIQQLIDQHPLKSTLATVVLQAWDIILDSKIGDFRIGKDIFPEPQIMGFFLHDVIALLLEKQFSDEYCLGNPKTQKDIHNLQNEILFCPSLQFAASTLYVLQNSLTLWL